ncbi:MAG: type II toxin-antitoxin system RatA family toxin [Steroidobacteraceae bacterium]|jgi:ribosome-associated toxin RatA of RatAB toxin-antitoxin module
MPELVRTALVNKPPAVLYGLVNDVRAYPQFVPGCTGVEVISESASEIVVCLAVRRGLLHTHLTTRNRLEPVSAVHMELVEGPLKQLTGRWSLTPVGQNGCRIELKLKFQFSNPIKAALIEPLIQDIASAMVTAFVARAQQLP